MSYSKGMASGATAKELKKLTADNARLRAENERLKKEAKPVSKQGSNQPLQILRRSGVVLLLAFAVALLTVGNLLFWFGNTVVKQDRFVAATAPIIKDPVVQDTLALYTTNKIFENNDVQGTIEQVLPPRADFLAPQLAKQLRTGVQSALDKALANPKFQDKWNEVQARQHDRLISFASKYQGDADISVNEIFNQLTASLKDTKLAFLADKQLPPKVGDVKVVSAAWLPLLHNVVTNIDTWRLLAVSLMVLSVAGAVLLSRRRRRVFYIFSLASIGTMLATLIALHLMRDRVIANADPQYTEGVRHVLQILSHSLVLQTVTILVAAAVIGVIAWVNGPSRQATAIRHQVGLLFAGKLHSKIFRAENKFTSWIAKNRAFLQWSVVGIFTVVMLLVRLTLISLFIYLLLIVILILLIEVLAGQAPNTKKRAKSA